MLRTAASHTSMFCPKSQNQEPAFRVRVLGDPPGLALAAGGINNPAESSIAFDMSRKGSQDLRRIARYIAIA